MHLSVTVAEELPPLTWAAAVGAQDGRVDLIAGRGVQIGDGWWFEGAWAGDFAEAGFDKTDVVCGSGGRLGPNGLTVVPPTHTLEAVYWAQRGGRALVSNSLAGLMTALGDEPSLSFPDYWALFHSVIYGLDWHRRAIPTAGGRIRRRFYHPFIPGGGDLRAPQAPAFRSFADYEAYLTERVRALTGNAAARGYVPLVSISSGYDSPAVASLARRAGCVRAFTFSTARKAGEDSGAAIADRLGMATTEYDRLAFEAVVGTGAEFFASGFHGSELPYAAIEGMLAGSLFFSGFHGGKVWGRTNSYANVPLLRGDASGSSFAEFRLRTAFVHAPLAFFGALRQADLNRIANSDEMREWSVGGDYDRPIARRLVEEAGVPRSMFGQAKKAVSTPVHDAGAMPPAGEAAYRTFLDRHSLESGPGRTSAFQAGLSRVWRSLYWRRKAILKATGIDVLMFDRFVTGSPHNPNNRPERTMAKRHFFAWGYDEIRDRYATLRGRLL